MSAPGNEFPRHLGQLKENQPKLSIPRLILLLSGGSYICIWLDCTCYTHFRMYTCMKSRCGYIISFAHTFSLIARHPLSVWLVHRAQITYTIPENPTTVYVQAIKTPKMLQNRRILRLSHFLVSVCIVRPPFPQWTMKSKWTIRSCWKK